MLHLKLWDSQKTGSLRFFVQSDNLELVLFLVVPEYTAVMPAFSVFARHRGPNRTQCFLPTRKLNMSLIGVLLPIGPHRFPPCSQCHQLSNFAGWPESCPAGSSWAHNLLRFVEPPSFRGSSAVVNISSYNEPGLGKEDDNDRVTWMKSIAKGESVSRTSVMSWRWNSFPRHKKLPYCILESVQTLSHALRVMKCDCARWTVRNMCRASIRAQIWYTRGVLSIIHRHQVLIQESLGYWVSLSLLTCVTNQSPNVSDQRGEKCYICGNAQCPLKWKFWMILLKAEAILASGVSKFGKSFSVTDRKDFNSSK